MEVQLYLKALEMLKQHIKKLDEKMIDYQQLKNNVRQDEELYEIMTKADQDVMKHPQAEKLYQKFVRREEDARNGYDPIKSSFESLDEQDKLVFVQLYEMKYLIKYVTDCTER